MCGSFKFLGLFAIVPTTMLLTVSFFVLVVARKIEEAKLKIFGYVIAVLLCICALITLSVGFYKISSGKYYMKQMRHPMMQQQMLNR